MTNLDSLGRDTLRTRFQLIRECDHFTNEPLIGEPVRELKPRRLVGTSELVFLGDD